MMTAQEIFDTVWRKMAEQGKPSKNDMGRCCYRGPEGTACAVGCLLTDDEAAATNGVMGGNVSVAGLKSHYLLPKRMLDHDILLGHLQSAHDYADADNWLANFQLEARQIADRHKLTVPA